MASKPRCFLPVALRDLVSIAARPLRIGRSSDEVGHAPVLRPPARNAWQAPVSWRTDGAGGRFSPGVMCRSMNRLVSSERLTSASNARSSTSPAMSWDASLDQPSAVRRREEARRNLARGRELSDSKQPVLALRSIASAGMRFRTSATISLIRGNAATQRTRTITWFWIRHLRSLMSERHGSRPLPQQFA